MHSRSFVRDGNIRVYERLGPTGDEAVELSDMLDRSRVKGNFLGGLSNSGMPQAFVFGITAPARKGDLVGVLAHPWGPASQNHMGLAPLLIENCDDRTLSALGWHMPKSLGGTPIVQRINNTVNTESTLSRRQVGPWSTPSQLGRRRTREQ